MKILGLIRSHPENMGIIPKTPELRLMLAFLASVIVKAEQPKNLY
jgi:hypothetical protein